MTDNDAASPFPKRKRPEPVWSPDKKPQTGKAIRVTSQMIMPKAKEGDPAPRGPWANLLQIWSAHDVKEQIKAFHLAAIPSGGASLPRWKYDGESTAWSFECFTLKQQNRIVSMLKACVPSQTTIVDASGPWVTTTARIEINFWCDDSGEFASLAGKVGALRSHIRELRGTWENGRYDGTDTEILLIALRHPDVSGNRKIRRN